MLNCIHTHGLVFSYDHLLNWKAYQLLCGHQGWCIQWFHCGLSLGFPCTLYGLHRDSICRTARSLQGRPTVHNRTHALLIVITSARLGFQRSNVCTHWLAWPFRITSGDLQRTNLVRVSVTQHEVGSFNVCMDILVLMDVLQYINLVTNTHTNTY